MYTIKKGDYTLRLLSESRKSIVCYLHYKNDYNKYCINRAGELYLAMNGEWALLDTSPIQKKREFKDQIDQAVYELVKTLSVFAIGDHRTKLRFRRDESVLLQALIYDLFHGARVDWLPSKESSVYPSKSSEDISESNENISNFEFSGKYLLEVGEDGVVSHEMPSVTGTEVATY